MFLGFKKSPLKSPLKVQDASKEKPVLTYAGKIGGNSLDAMTEHSVMTTPFKHSRKDVKPSAAAKSFQCSSHEVHDTPQEIPHAQRVNVHTERLTLRDVSMDTATIVDLGKEKYKALAEVQNKHGKKQSVNLHDRVLLYNMLNRLIDEAHQ